jgi:hypothetical protein
MHLTQRWRNLAAYCAKLRAEFAAKETRIAAKQAKLAATQADLAAEEADTAQQWARFVQDAEAGGVLAKLTLTLADLEQCQTRNALLDLVHTAMGRVLAGPNSTIEEN